MIHRYLIQARLRDGLPNKWFIVGPPILEHEEAVSGAKRLTPDWIDVHVVTQHNCWGTVDGREKIRD